MKTSEKIIIRYDGPILADHQMDISDLAPALLGISELCKIANKKFNGDRSSVQVMMKADIEQKCVQLELQIVLLSVWDNLKSLIADDNIKSAKEVLEWIGILGGGLTGVYGVIKLASILKDEKEISTKMIVKDGRNLAALTITGDNNTVTNVIYTYPEALELLQDNNAITSIKKIVSPVIKDGYEKLEFDANNHIECVSKKEAATIISFDPIKIESTVDEPQTISAWVSVYAPVYDKDAPNWRFRYGESKEYMDISETSIASDAIERGGALMDDTYYVRLEIRQEHNPGGKIKNNYKIKEVLNFKPATTRLQKGLFDDKSQGSPEER